ncbi:MAG: hypothetical protein ONB44_00830 [candidate division KSB1 bacterium]|nr:hypothetical protein [candidate division KSB1 bacterium]MDZ7300663.1 hypothetical protein [candidate division KSB1 bacterium]MDZ7309800.1 hypothetical protein [candidate division KSB1 bacterium]
MTTSEYAQKLVAFIEARPHHIDLDELLAEVNVRAKLCPTLHDQIHKRRTAKEHVHDDMRKGIHFKFAEHSRSKKARKNHR